MKRTWIIILIAIILLLASCTHTPQFVKGGQYILIGEYTAMYTDNGSYIYTIGGRTLTLGNKQPQPQLLIGHDYRIVWELLTNNPQIIRILSIEDINEAN